MLACADLALATFVVLFFSTVSRLAFPTSLACDDDFVGCKGPLLSFALPGETRSEDMFNSLQQSDLKKMYDALAPDCARVPGVPAHSKHRWFTQRLAQHSKSDRLVN